MEKQNKLQYIEGIRGILAMLVVTHHFMNAFFPATYWGAEQPSHMLHSIDIAVAQSPLSFLFAGNFAVCFFFLISGAVLAIQFEKKEGALSTFLYTRYFKLFLPVFATSVVVYIFMKSSLFYSVEASQITGSYWLSALYNFSPNFAEVVKTSFISVPFFGNSTYNTAFWMLRIIFVGTFLSYIVLYLTNKMAQKRLFLLAAIIILFQMRQFYYAAFIFGILLIDEDLFIYKLHNQKFLPLLLLIMGIYLAAFPTALMPDSAIYKFLYIDENSFSVYHILAAVFIFMAVRMSSKMQKALSNKLFLFLGENSFSLFLTHIIVLCSFSCFMFLQLYGATQKYQTSTIITFLCTILVTIIVATVYNKTVLTYIQKAIQKVSQKIKKHVENKL